MRKVQVSCGTKGFWLLALVITVFMVSTACDNDPDPYVAPPIIHITKYPVSSITVAEGQVETLSVTAAILWGNGAITGYQWYKNDTQSNVGGTKITGATSASYDIPSDLTVGEHFFFCEVMASNGAEPVRTYATKVTVGVLDFGIDIGINQPYPVDIIQSFSYRPSAYTDTRYTAITHWTTYQWYVDGEAQTGNGATTAEYTFNRPPGVYIITVVVTNNAGEKYSESRRVTVR